MTGNRNQNQEKTENKKSNSIVAKQSCLLMVSLTISLNLGFFSLEASGSESLFKPLYEEGKKNVLQRNYAEGEKLLEMAMQNAEHLKPDSPELLNLYSELGQAYTCTGKVAKAEPLFKKVLEIREKDKKKSEDMNLFQAVVQLGTVYRRQDKFAESEALYKQGLQLFEGKGPIKSLFQATVMFALASLYLDTGKSVEAETLMKQALILRKQAAFSQSLALGALYEGLGRSLYQQGKWDEAEATYKLAIESTDKKPENSRDLAFTCGSLAAVYQAQGRFVDARKLLEDSIAILKDTDGSASTNVANAYCKYAELAIAQGQYNEAESYARKALSIHEKLNGEEHTNVAADMEILIDVFRNQGKYSAAEALGKRCIEIFAKALGRDSSKTAYAMEKLAWVYCDQAKYTEAQKYCKDAIEILTQKEGSNAHVMPPLLRQLAAIERGMKNTKECERLLLQASDMLAKDKSPDIVLLGYIYSELALLYRAENNLEKAEENSKKALALQEKIYGADHGRLLGDLNLLVKLYAEQNRAADLNAVKARIDAIYVSHPDLKRAIAAAQVPEASAPIMAANAAVSTRPVKSKWALVIGVSTFENPEINLKYAAKDAVDFSNYLLTDAHFAADHVKVLTDKEATRDNIIKQLGDAWLGHRAAPDDLVVIYVSSHGSVSRTEAGGVNFLVAYDTKPDGLLSTGIPMQWLSQMIKEQVHSNRVVLVLDVCHSGASSSGDKGLVRENSFDVSKVGVGEGQAIVCSSAPEQVSWESKNYPNSVFTRRLIEGLKQDNSGADLNRAFSYLKDQVESEVLRDRGKLQTPLMFSKSWQGAPPVLSVGTSQ